MENGTTMERDLRHLLIQINENYTNYEVRYDLVLKALLAARELKYRCGFRYDSKDPDWPVIVIELPEIGQVSWHMPPSNIAWDGSTVVDTQRRCYHF